MGTEHVGRGRLQEQRARRWIKPQLGSYRAAFEPISLSGPLVFTLIVLEELNSRALELAVQSYELRTRAYIALNLSLNIRIAINERTDTGPVPLPR